MAKVALIDISGTVLIGNKLIGNAINALKRLRQHDVKFKFLSNTTKESKRKLVNRLNQLGLQIELNEVVTSLTAAKKYIVDRKLRPHLVLDEEAKEEFVEVDQNKPNCVLVGLAPNSFNYKEMNESFRYLLNGAELIAVHKGRYYKREDGLALGPGPFVEALEFAAGRKAAVIGKPEKDFFSIIKKELEVLDMRNTYFMIGDDVFDDIHGAQNAGCHGILVKTGKYRDGDERKIDPKPFALVDSFDDAVDLIIKY